MLLRVVRRGYSRLRGRALQTGESPRAEARGAALGVRAAVALRGAPLEPRQQRAAGSAAAATAGSAAAATAGSAAAATEGSGGAVAARCGDAAREGQAGRRACLAGGRMSPIVLSPGVHRPEHMLWWPWSTQ